MKTIVWVTSGYLLQVDLPILDQLNKEYKIKWIVYAAKSSDKGQHAKEYASKHGIDVEFVSLHSHRYLPMAYFEHAKEVKYLASLNADLYYFDIIAFPYLLFAIKKYPPNSSLNVWIFYIEKYHQKISTSDEEIFYMKK